MKKKNHFCVILVRCINNDGVGIPKMEEGTQIFEKGPISISGDGTSPVLPNVTRIIFRDFNRSFDDFSK